MTAPAREVFYGGAAGGGKTDALLMAALEYVDRPGYAALLLRRTFADLALPGALMDRAHEWLGATAARWNDAQPQLELSQWRHAVVRLLGDRARQVPLPVSSELQYIGFDELTQFTEPQYLYLFSRLRRGADCDIPLRMRAASNPGGVGHEWVRARFIDAADIPSGSSSRRALPITPTSTRRAYRQSLLRLDAVTRAQLLEGDWQVRPEGALFSAAGLPIVEAGPAQATRVRYWDKAATEGGGARTRRGTDRQDRVRASTTSSR